MLSDRPPDIDIQHELAQLRHAYAQCMGGHVKSITAFADGLIGPVIKSLENKLEARRRAWADWQFLNQGNGTK